MKQAERLIDFESLSIIKNRNEDMDMDVVTTKVKDVVMDVVAVIVDNDTITAGLMGQIGLMIVLLVLSATTVILKMLLLKIPKGEHDLHVQF